MGRARTAYYIRRLREAAQSGHVPPNQAHKANVLLAPHNLPNLALSASTPLPGAHRFNNTTPHNTPALAKMSDGEVEVEAPQGFSVLPKDVVQEIGSIKLFNKWSYEDVEIRDISLTYVDNGLRSLLLL